MYMEVLQVKVLPYFHREVRSTNNLQVQEHVNYLLDKKACSDVLIEILFP